LKEFIVYILHSHNIAYVPNSYVKDILTQPDPKGKRGKWIVVLLEYDLEIIPTKLIKGQGLEKPMAQTNCELLGINFMLTCQHVQRKREPLGYPKNSLNLHGM
jgi:hypothetical protein